MSELNRYNIGINNLKHIDGHDGDTVIEALSGLSEDVAKYIIEFVFGDIYNRQTLDLKQREMITITSLLSLGNVESQLKVHIKASLNVGLSQKEIIETFIQCIPYVGFPRVLNAIFVAKKIFEEKEGNDD